MAILVASLLWREECTREGGRSLWILELTDISKAMLAHRCVKKGTVLHQPYCTRQKRLVSRCVSLFSKKLLSTSLSRSPRIGSFPTDKLQHIPQPLSPLSLGLRNGPSASLGTIQTNFSFSCLVVDFGNLQVLEDWKEKLLERSRAMRRGSLTRAHRNNIFLLT